MYDNDQNRNIANIEFMRNTLTSPQKSNLDKAKMIFKEVFSFEEIEQNKSLNKSFARLKKEYKEVFDLIEMAHKTQQKYLTEAPKFPLNRADADLMNHRVTGFLDNILQIIGTNKVEEEPSSYSKIRACIVASSNAKNGKGNLLAFNLMWHIANKGMNKSDFEKKLHGQKPETTPLYQAILEFGKGNFNDMHHYLNKLRDMQTQKADGKQAKEHKEERHRRPS